MPELPEVETTRQGLEPALRGQKVSTLTVRDSRLRWPVPAELQNLVGSEILGLRRRSKYLLLNASTGCALIHLGMSGSLRLTTPTVELRPHDHLLLDLDSGAQLRYHDPRRFGSWHWISAGEDPLNHPLLRNLGPEPLGPDFSMETLANACRGRARAIKLTLMDAAVVVGVGNIYACEALFDAGIDPRRPSSRLSRARLGRLVEATRAVLTRSIQQGGTTLRDFVNGQGNPGYFAQSLQVYGREGQPCPRCQRPIRREVLGQRSTWFCPHCQR